MALGQLKVPTGRMEAPSREKATAEGVDTACQVEQGQIRDSCGTNDALAADSLLFEEDLQA